MQPSHPDIAVSIDEKNRSPKKVLAIALGAGLLVLSLALCEVAPVAALLLGLLGLLAVAFGQVKGPVERSFRSSLRAAAMVSARMDSIPDAIPPSSGSKPKH
jgi:xanthosine utilization system XapX-like protein